MTLLLLLNPRYSSSAVIPPVIPSSGAVGGGGGGWANSEYVRRHKKGKKIKEVLVRYLKGEDGTQEEIEVEINVDFGRVLSTLLKYEDARAQEKLAEEEADRQIARIKAKRAEEMIRRLVKAKETAEALRAAKVIEDYVKTKKKRRRWEEEEEFLLLKLLEDDL